MSTATTLARGKPPLISRISASHRARGRPFEPGPEQRVHHDGGLAHGRGDLAADRAAARLEHAVVLGRLAAQLRRVRRQHHVQAGRPQARVELARHHQAVAAVVALAAQDHDAVLAERRELLRQELHHAVAGVLHQDESGNAELHGAAVHFAHLGSGEHFHFWTSASLCSSLCRFSGSPMTTR